MVLFAAIFADTVDLKAVPSCEVVILAADFLLKLADFLRKKFDRAAAIGADHMVMAAAVVLVFIAGNTVMEGDFAGQAALRQQFQRAVDGGVADAGIFFLHQAVQFVGGEMVAGFKKSMENGVALRRLLQANRLQMAMKNLLRLADHLAGDGGLIIDALLQHGVELSQDTIRAS